MTKGQQSDLTFPTISFLYFYNILLYISNNILAVHNNAVFCITPTLYVSLAFQSTYRIFSDNFKVTYHYRHDIYYLEFPQSSNLFVQVMVLFHFFPFFLPTFTSAGTAILMIIPFCPSLSITIMSGLLASITLSQLTLISRNALTSHFLLLLLKRVLTTSPCVLTHSSYKTASGLSLYIVLLSLIFFLSKFLTLTY